MHVQDLCEDLQKHMLRLGRLWQQENARGAAVQLLAARTRILLLELQLAGFTDQAGRQAAACQVMNVLDPSGQLAAAFAAGCSSE